jgi:hypothetical protein
MSKLSDFKPLKRIRLEGVADVDVSGLVVIVGPNSSGKSRLLRDIYERIGGNPQALVVAQDIELDPPDAKSLLSCLEQEGYLEQFQDENGALHVRPKTSQIGSGGAIQQVEYRVAEGMSIDVAQLKQNRRSGYLGYYGKYLVTGLFLDRRLLTTNETNTYDFLTQAPQNELHALYLNEAARVKLLAEVQTTFRKAIWPDTSRGSVLCLKVSDSPEIPSADDRLNPGKMAKYRGIDSEGDGMKSYAAICSALLLGRRPVCLVDEPEMCLHPPQAYNLGRFIGKFGSSRDTVTFVSTHSSNVLRGALQTAPNLQIIRLRRESNKFVGHLVSADELKNALTKPTVRAESILDGIFSQGVLIVEADTDRTVYQAVWETLHDEFPMDVHFSTVGGTGGIADTLKLYKALTIPVGVLADIDLVLEIETLEKILVQCVPSDQVSAVLDAAKLVAADLKRLPPTITPSEFKSRLAEVVEARTDWEEDDDAAIREQLSALRNDIDRMRRIKRGGIAAVPSPTKEKLQALVDNFAKFGLFLVPCGELEQWLIDEGVKSSKSNKAQWANEASSIVRSRGVRDGDVWDYLRSVGRFLVSYGEGGDRREELALRDQPAATTAA